MFLNQSLMKIRFMKSYMEIFQFLTLLRVGSQTPVFCSSETPLNNIWRQILSYVTFIRKYLVLMFFSMKFLIE